MKSSGFFCGLETSKIFACKHHSFRKGDPLIVSQQFESTSYFSPPTLMELHHRCHNVFEERNKKLLTSRRRCFSFPLNCTFLIKNYRFVGIFSILFTIKVPSFQKKIVGPQMMAGKAIHFTYLFLFLQILHHFAASASLTITDNLQRRLLSDHLTHSTALSLRKHCFLKNISFSEKVGATDSCFASELTHPSATTWRLTYHFTPQQPHLDSHDHVAPPAPIYLPQVSTHCFNKYRSSSFCLSYGFFHTLVTQSGHNLSLTSLNYLPIVQHEDLIYAPAKDMHVNDLLV